jgi:hypothetical protein
VLVLLAGATVVALAGCSGGGSTTPPKADFTVEANAICTTGNKAIDDASKHLDTNDPVALKKFLTDVSLPNIEDQLKQIKGLGYPDGDRDRLQAIYAQMDKIVARLGKDSPAQVLHNAGDAFDGVNAELNAYGLTSCGNP